MFLKIKSIQAPKGQQPAYAPNYWCCEEREEFIFFGWSWPAGLFLFLVVSILPRAFLLFCDLENIWSQCFLVCSVQCPGRNQQPEISWPDCVIVEVISQVILPARGEYCLRGLSKCQLEMEEANKELPVSCWSRLRKLYWGLKVIFTAFTLILCWLIMSSSMNSSFSLSCVPMSFVNISELCFVHAACILWECGHTTGPSPATQLDSNIALRVKWWGF